MRPQLNTAFLIAFLTLLTACVPALPADGTLPFQSVEQKSDTHTIGQQQYEALEPGLWVFSTHEDFLGRAYWFTESAQKYARTMDWGTFFLAAAFQGWQPGDGSQITVERVLWAETRVDFEVTRKLPSEESGGMVTSPYHLIAVRRPFNLTRDWQFQMMEQGQLITSFATPQP